LILKTVSDRWAIEEHFHDVKEIWGAGEQQVRNLRSSIGCWNLCGWLFTLVELECWNYTSEQLVDRTDRPWDNPDRRPSHNDRRRRIAREMLRETFLRDLNSPSDHAKIRDHFGLSLSGLMVNYLKCRLFIHPNVDGHKNVAGRRVRKTIQRWGIEPSTAVARLVTKGLARPSCDSYAREKV
jgi:hypothetical protein